MSRRTFARQFVATPEPPPYRWLLDQWVKRAQRMLETTDLTVDAIAQRCGMTNAVNLRKHFGRARPTTPQAYRHAFRSRTAHPAVRV